MEFTLHFLAESAKPWAVPDSNNTFILTKIVATLGPATTSTEAIRSLIQEGVRVFRINFSHGTFEQHRKALELVRECSRETDKHIGVLGDLCGPKLRVGQQPAEGIELQNGEQVAFLPDFIDMSSARETLGDIRVLTANFHDFIFECEPGHRILLDDGGIELKCVRRETVAESAALICEVVAGNRLFTGKGINFPDTPLTLPSLTDKDYECVDFAVQHGFDFLALSFVRSAQDVRELKDYLRKHGARPANPKKQLEGPSSFSVYSSGFRSFIPVIAKIEKPQALENLAAIVTESDVIMVARGDLGVEVDMAQLPVLQKHIIQTCHDFGKPVIVATQMLQSMIDSPNPTRAEVNDVANAIFDGADAVMLSGETAVGKYPTRTVQMMRRIAQRTNAHLRSIPMTTTTPSNTRESRYRTAALAHGVKVVVRDLNAKLVVMWSQLGGGASYLSQMRMTVPIIAFSSDLESLRRMSIMYGVTPMHMEKPKDSNVFLEAMDRLLVERGYARKSDPVVMVAGQPFGRAGVTNTLRIHYVEEG